MLSNEYVAGFFDGEGCISIMRTRFKRLKSDPSKRVRGTAIHITINNTDIGVLRKLSERYSGNIYSLRDGRGIRKRQLYGWQVTGREKQERFLHDILPYSIVKKEQIEVALEYLSTQNGGRVLASEVHEKRFELMERLTNIKQQDYLRMQ